MSLTFQSFYLEVLVNLKLDNIVQLGKRQKSRTAHYYKMAINKELMKKKYNSPRPWKERLSGKMIKAIFVHETSSSFSQIEVSFFGTNYP